MSDRGRLIRYCHAHDYGDPGFPPSECFDCKFEKDDATPAPAPTAPEAKRLTTNRALEALDRIIDSWRASSVDGPNDDDWTRAHNETLRHCCDEFAALSVAEHTRETEALERLAVHLRLHEAMHPGAPTAPAQPAPDEGAVKALARVLFGTLRLVGITWESIAVEHARDEYRAMARAAIAWADRRYGGEVAALRGALEGVVRTGEAQDAHGAVCDDCRDNGEPCEEMQRLALAAAEAEVEANRILALTPSQAGEAVTKLADLACNVADAFLVPGLFVSINGPEAAAAVAFLHELGQAAQPFLTARGGGGR